jgi:hypothetical protein
MEFWTSRHGISVLLHERSERSSTRLNSTNFGAKSQYMYVLEVVYCLASRYYTFSSLFFCQAQESNSETL